ncbi:DEAD/DEAH box helicase [Pelagicoccus sp. SDUM812005]|uniref:DEAD/DEAH box helicase n=1 Tax=Pelagicoccus sp. SDUM812005 TaxID=3041257 RepID=UPI00280CC97D|nr:DEAD/DEAH box helicase [Pelagicoccus sp. SDUM812005]MDQ8180844.1 DEAD/DEAH box helicase [Pelagicoccus sp. SDUM812005]
MPSPAPTLTLSPQGRLSAVLDTDAPSPQAKRLQQAFARSTSEGLLYLCTQYSSTSSPSLDYWKSIASLLLEHLCRLPAAAPLPDEIPPPNEELKFRALSAPPFPGGEYLSATLLAQVWSELSQHLRQQIADSSGKVGDWLKTHAPKWHQVGRVCFHLAENKNDPQYPFAFMATYAPGLGDSGQVKFLPLAHALQEYAGAKNKARLLQLLEPVHQASQQIPFVAQLLETGDLYHPIAWTPDEAYALLQTIPELEACGLLTRLPNWWKARPRPQVAITLGQKKSSSVGLNALLSFKMEFALGEQKLSPAEIETLLQNAEGLVRLNGQWVEVDREKLQQALDHWKRVQAHTAHGNLTFAQGMRLLAGAPQNLGSAPQPQDLETVNDWSSVTATHELADTLKRLRQPELIEAASDHPGLQGQLRPYQETGFKWLRLLTQLGLGACLADDMGLGKTIQIIALLLDTHRQNPKPKNQNPAPLKKPPSLLVLPASLLANWKNEFAAFAPSLRLRCIHPSETPAAELKAYQRHPQRALENADVLLTTYGMLTRQDWLAQQDWNLVVIDEAQAIKNPNTQQTRAVKRLRAHARIALTGTPVENTLSDLWSLFDFTCPGLLGTPTAFQKFSDSLQRKGHTDYSPLRKLVSPYLLRRLKTDKSIISDLPDKTEVKAYCTLAPKQAALYKRTVAELAKDLREVEGMQRRGLVLTYLTRFKQICNHPSQALGDNAFAPEASGKFLRLRELCEEIAARQEKVLVFTQFREMTAPISAYLATLFGRPGLVLHGGTPVAQRQSLVASFQDPDGPPHFVLSLKAGGSGLTLTAATHVIHFDRWWNPAVENQATDRAYRIGQKKNVLVHKFVSRGTVEEKVDQLIRSKNALSQNLLENTNEPALTELSDADLLQLVTLDINTA